MNMNIVNVSDLSFSYDGENKILDQVNFKIEKGETLVIAGLSGCGKTTLCYCLTGVIPECINGEMSGKIHIADDKKIGLVFQNPDDQLVCTTVEDEIAFGLENLCVEPDDILRRVHDECEFFGISALKNMNPSKLSGGQKKLVTIASIMVMNPELLILDEPMTGLDEDARMMVYEGIEKMKQAGCTIIAVEHDLSLAGYGDRVVYLRNGKIYD